LNLQHNKSSDVYFQMNKKLETSVSIKDIIDQILSIPREQEPLIEDIRINLSDPKSNTFFVLNEETLLEEKIHLLEPLYSNDYIKKLPVNRTLILRFKLGATQEESMIANLLIKKSGYAKLSIPNGINYYQWRECKIKGEKNGSIFDVEFKTFVNNCKKNL
jgi:hypothetical protein